MEVEGLGARCTLASCQRLDYLPIHCPHCKNPFCSDHSNPTTHSCPYPGQSTTTTAATSPSPSNFVPTCPICNSPVPTPPHLDADAAMSAHIDAGCPKRKRSNPLCAHPDCGVRDPAATACVRCGKVFCIRHCIEANHACVVGRPVAHGVFGGGRGVVASAGASGGGGGGSGHEKGKGKGKGKGRGWLNTGGETGGRNTTRVTASPSRKHYSGGDVQRPSAAPASTTANDAARLPGRMDIANTKATALGLSQLRDVDDKLTLTFFFPSSTNTQAHHVAVNARHSPGRIIDSLHSLLPELPRAGVGGRYELYGVRGDLSGVQLLPFMTPLREVPGVAGVCDGDFAVVVGGGGEGGLDPRWMVELSKIVGVGRGGVGVGRRMQKLKGRKGASKCAVA